MSNSWVVQKPDSRAIQSLDSGLGLVSHGCERDYVSGLVDRSLWGQFNSGRFIVTESFHRATSMTLLPSHSSAEQRQEAKHGTYARRPPFFVPDDTGISMAMLVRRYFEPHAVSLGGDALQYADEKVRALFNPVKGLLNLCSLRTAEESFQGKTGLGWPVFSSDRSLLPVVREMSAEIIRAGYPHESVFMYPAVVGFRGQPRGPGKFCKFRAIFQCSRVIGNLEKMLQIPLHEALRHHPSGVFSAWNGRNAVNIAVTQLMRRSARPIASVDFSNFDASVPSEVIRRVFGIIRDWFHRSWHSHIKYLEEVFCGCGIIIPSDRPDKKRTFLSGESRGGGVPSGSVLTNLIDSLVNLWVVHYAAARDSGVVTDALVQGDDGVYRFAGTDIEKVAKRLSSELGMTLSVEKSLVSSREVHFLQNVHHRDYEVDGVLVGVRPLMRVLNGMMSYEDINRRWDDKPLYDAFRWLQQLENASDHPAFSLACKWLLSKAPEIPRAISIVLRNDRDLLARVKGALSGKYEWGKVAIDGIGTSHVFQTMCSLVRKAPS